jgi:hypothetical protein
MPKTKESLNTAITIFNSTYGCRGARRELGLMRHACLAFMAVGDDGLDHKKLLREGHLDRERVFIDCNSPSFQSCG